MNHKSLDKLELDHVRLAMKKVKCPCKLDISVFYQLTRRLPYEELEYDAERFLIYFFDTFCNESIKSLGKRLGTASTFYTICWLKLARNPM